MQKSHKNGKPAEEEEEEKKEDSSLLIFKLYKWNCR